MGVLELNLTYFPMQWVLNLVTPHVIIDGYPQRRNWGQHFIELPTGQHHVRAAFPYLLSNQCCPAEAMVPIYQGMVTRLFYDTPPLIFMKGTMRLSGPFQLPHPMFGWSPQS